MPEAWRKGLAPVLYHHKPQDRLSKVVALADRLSAAEREGSGEGKERQLLSVFCRLGNTDTRPADRFWPLKPLALTREALFPRDPLSKADEAAAYSDLWHRFVDEVAKLPGDDLAAYLEGLYYALQRYAWCVPGAYYRSLPDVSLFDHSRTTAALAACLIDLDEPTLDELLAGKRQGDPLVLLVGGDISGVQKFLYSLSSENAAKSLRGRSFYLGMLAEAVALFVLDQLKLPITNLLYAGGGSLYVLAGADSNDTMATLQANITRRLFRAHEGALRLALAWTPASRREFQVGDFASAWDRLHRRLLQAKARPMAELDADEMAEHLGHGFGSGGDVTACLVCGREEAGLKDNQTCSLCNSLETLGNQLAHATHLVVAQQEASDATFQRVPRWWDGLEQFGINVWVADCQRELKSEPFLSGGPESVDLVRVFYLKRDQLSGQTDETLYKEARARGPVVIAHRPFPRLVPYTWDKTAERERIATFDELAAQSTGIKRWGVLRMDVDNLSLLFRDGFKRQEIGYEANGLTLSRVASLSFALRLFFEGYVATIGQRYQGYTAHVQQQVAAELVEEQGYCDKLYLQYAGGDDLFVVGAWDALPEFAADVRNGFNQFVCHNPALTLSGGTTLHPARFPLYQAADQAGQAEFKAKSLTHKQRNGGKEEKKNAFCFLDTTLGWGEFEHVQGLVAQMRDWIEGGRVSHALLQNLLTLRVEWERGQREALRTGRLEANQLYYGPWIWHAVYQLSRTAAAKDTHREVKEQVYIWMDKLMTDPSLLLRLALAARWTEILKR